MHLVLIVELVFPFKFLVQVLNRHQMMLLTESIIIDLDGLLLRQADQFSLRLDMEIVTFLLLSQLWPALGHVSNLKWLDTGKLGVALLRDFGVREFSVCGS